MEKSFVVQDRIFLPDPGMFRQEHKMTPSCRGKNSSAGPDKQTTKLKGSFTNLIWSET